METSICQEKKMGEKQTKRAHINHSYEIFSTFQECTSLRFVFVCLFVCLFFYIWSKMFQKITIILLIQKSHKMAKLDWTLATNLFNSSHCARNLSHISLLSSFISFLSCSIWLISCLHFCRIVSMAKFCSL